MEVLLGMVASVYLRVQWEAVWAVGIVGGSSCLLSCCDPGLAVTVMDMHRERRETAMLTDKDV